MMNVLQFDVVNTAYTVHKVKMLMTLNIQSDINIEFSQDFFIRNVDDYWMP